MPGIGLVCASAARRRLLCVAPLLLALLLLSGLFCASAAAAASVVRELSEKRTETSKTFLLSDGSRRAVIFETPIHYSDESGQWRQIDTSLIMQGAFDEYRSAATPVAISFAAEAPGCDPVDLVYDGARISFNLLGARESKPLVLGARATYFDVAAATDLAYEVLDDGLKETLSLASSAAPDRFSFFVAHAGLELRQDLSGQWGFYRPGEKTPLLVMSPLLVYDSSINEAGDPAYCAAATLSVNATSGGSYVTYTLPRAWLEDAARVFPVTIDPSVTRSASADTYIASAYPTTAYGAQDDVHVGYYDSTTGWNRGLFKFSLPSDLSGAYVHAAHLRLYQWWQYYASQAMSTHIGVVNESWSESSTWNSLGTLAFTSLGTDSVARAQWLDYSCPSTVQDWADGTTNNGFVVYQNSGEGQGYWRKFCSSEYATTSYRPQLTIDYESPSESVSAYTSAYRLGDTVVASTVVNTAYQNDVHRQFLIVNYDNGNPRRGYLAWFDTGQTLPSGWAKARTLSDGSYFAYATAASYGNAYITPDWQACTVGWTATYHRVTFRFRLNEDFGDVQNNDFDTRFWMGPGSALAYDSGWINQDTNVCIYPEPVTPLASTTQASSAWFSEVDTNSDGLPDNLNDSADQGRGAVTLSWPAVARADGYNIYLFDGASYRKVGQRVGNAATTWSSADFDFYPKDSEINAASWPGGASGNPFYRAATPSQASQLGTPLAPSVGASTGVVATDGSYLYVRRWGSQATPVRWKKINPANGNVVATIGAADLPGQALTGFYHGGYLYSGYITGVTGGNGLLDRTNVATGAESTLTLAPAPLARSTGIAVTAASGSILLASDGQQIYSLSYMEDGLYNGYKIRVYDMTGARVGTSDHVIPVASEYIDGVLADGKYLYLMQWTGADGAHVTKISTTTWQVVNQWSLDQGATRAIGGCYDAASDTFWLGAYDQAKLYKYAGITGGRDLRDNPAALQARQGGVALEEAATSYKFWVKPYNEAGEPPCAVDGGSAITLESRTHHLYDEDHFTTSDLGSFAGHEATAVLNTGALDVEVCDLAIDTWGPDVTLSRHYASDLAAGRGALFAPQWRFNFERCLSGISATSVDYLDEEGHAHRFHKPVNAAAWIAPEGYEASLATASAPAAWQISFHDKSVLRFDADGRLLSESDCNNNTVSYTATGNTLAITAANGQAIVVTFTDATRSRIASASYTVTVNGQPRTREVDYTNAAPWEVTYFRGQSGLERTLRYGADASGYLTSISQRDWPSAGQHATESFTFTAGALSALQYATYDAQSAPDAHLSIVYDNPSRSARVLRYGTVNGTPNSLVSEETSWTEIGTLDRTKTYLGTTAPADTPTLLYDSALGETPGSESLMVGETVVCQVLAAVDGSGDVRAATDENSKTTTYAYDDAGNKDLPTAEIDPRGAATANTYDAAGNLTATQSQLNSNADGSAKEFARCEYSYDACGRLTEKRELIAGTFTNGVLDAAGQSWATTSYANFAANGEPQTIVYHDVKLSSAGAPRDLSETRSYDAFGNLLTQVNTGGVKTATLTYDLAGNLLSETQATGVVSHHLYDALGNEVETWKSSSASQSKVDWRKNSYDALGRLVLVKELLDDGSPDGLTASLVTNTYDALGNRITSDDSTVAGEPARWLYDARGNVVKEWQEGVVAYSDDRATRSVYDADNRATAVTRPGESAATTTTYLADGSVLRVSDADGSWREYAYDDAGNKIRETKPLAGYTASAAPKPLATTRYAYDLGGRLTATTQPDGAVTSLCYDLLGRQTSATGQFAGSPPATTTTYNTLGWVLAEADANGVVESTVYDTCGRATSVVKGNQTAIVSTYDAAGRLLTRSESDAGGLLRVLTNSYDSFGRLSTEEHTVAGACVKHITRDYDTLSRPLKSHDTVSGRTHTWTYPLNTASGVVECEKYDAEQTPSTATTITSEPRGLESSRQTVADALTLTRAIPASGGRDAAERVVKALLTLPGGGALSSQYLYDSAGRLTRQWGAGYTAAAASTDAYAYDPDTGLKVSDNLQLASLGSLGAISASYAYNANERLTSATVNGLAETFSYDAAGNLTSVTRGATTTTYTYDAANRLTQASDGTQTTTYGWDQTNGWRSSQGPQGVSPAPISYSYTATGRLKTYANTAASPAVSASYSYDALGQRRKSVVTQGTLTTTTTYSYSGHSLLELSATRSDGASWKLSYLRDEHGELYGGIYREPAASSAPLCFAVLSNERGDILALLDSSGTPFASYRYDAFGNPTAQSTQATSLVSAATAAALASRQVLRYASYAYDAESGLYYLSARHYDPATRQFLAADPAKADGEESAYQYCAGNPIANRDPSGQFSLRSAWTRAKGGVQCWWRWRSRPQEVNYCEIDAGGTRFVAKAALRVAGPTVRAGAKAVAESARRGGDSLAAALGRLAHRELDARVLLKQAKDPRWLSNPRIRGANGKWYKPDVVTPRGHIIEMKPDTPSGRLHGRYKARVYEKQLGKRVRIIYHNRIP